MAAKPRWLQPAMNSMVLQPAQHSYPASCSDQTIAMSVIKGGDWPPFSLLGGALHCFLLAIS
jgi:hypothetical protein